MTIFDAFRNTMLVGLGAQEKAREFMEELVKKGELSESQGAKIFKEWSEKTGKTSMEIPLTFIEMISKPMEKLNLATKEDIEKINKKISTLTARVSKLEDSEEADNK